MKYIFLIVILFTSSIMLAQNVSEEKIPYYEIPEYPDTFTAGTMAARMIDALGFRYYWASASLEEKDLSFRPSDSARSTEETVNHILDLSYVILNSTLKKPNENIDKSTMAYRDKRIQTLVNLKTAANILKDSDDISQYKIIFGENEIPFWNQVNGPIADAIWHCGQLATFRRTSGNPINPNINQFRGTVKQ